MESISLILCISLATLCASFLSIFYYKELHNNTAGKKALPRAGGTLPIIGHLHHLFGKVLLHKKLSAWADKHGAAFAITLGSQTNLVISTMEMAKEVFTTLDVVLADRPQIAAARILSYNSAMIGLAPYGPYWRNMRKIATLQLLSHKRIGILTDVRTLEVRTSIKELYDLTAKKRAAGETVDVKQWFHDLMLNTFIRMVGGKRFIAAGEESGTAIRRREAMDELFYYFGVFNLSDAFPWLAWLDLQGHEKAMKRIAKELDELMEEWLHEHKERRKTKKEADDQDFMDVLLSTLEASDVPQQEADTITKSNCLNMILGGSEALSITLTWALSLLLNNPTALKKAQEEVDAHVSRDRHVTESDTNNLVYIQSVVKETLRLYPPNPVIAMHCASEDCTLAPNGYHIPFGSGRRSCPGTALGLRIAHFTLASLLHCFHVSKSSDAPIDMTESPGLSNSKAAPLQVYLSPRLHPQIYAA